MRLPSLRPPALARIRRPRFEPLEERRLLAGNVQVSVRGGSLFVRGDGADNVIAISQVASGQYTVEGFTDSFTGRPTTINRGSNPLTVSGIQHNFDIDLGRGGDRLGIGNNLPQLNSFLQAFENGAAAPAPTGIPADVVNLPRHLFVRLGDGDDAVALNVNAQGLVEITTGNGIDAAFVQSSTVGVNLLVNTGAGSDRAELDATSVRVHASIVTAAGDDVVRVQDFSSRSVVVDEGSGQDRFSGLGGLQVTRDMTLLLGSGDDFELVFHNGARLTGPSNPVFIGGNLLIDTGAGNDGLDRGITQLTQMGGEVAVSPVTGPEKASFVIGGQLTVVTGAGNDAFSMLYVKANGMVIDTGAGNDNLSIGNATVANDLVVVTGAGRDAIGVGSDIRFVASTPEDRQTRIGRNLIVNTGAGDDSLIIGVDASILGNIPPAALVSGAISIGRDAIVNTGSGRDFVGIGFNNAAQGIASGVNVGRNAVLDTGADQDTVNIEFAAVADSFFAYLGAGNDDFLAIRNSSARKSILRGGPGNNDQLIDNGGNSFTTFPDFKEFEVHP